MCRLINNWKRLFFILAMLLISCRTQFPRAPAPEPENDSILSEKNIPIPQFLEIWLFEFSPDKSKLAVLGFPKEYDDGETDPEFMYLPPSTLIVLEWPSLTELYRYDPGSPGPDDSDLVEVQWAPGGDALYVINKEWNEDAGEYTRFLTRIDFATEKVISVPFEAWNFTISPDGREVVAWGNSIDDKKWLWANEILVYDAQDLTIAETILIPEVQQIGFVYPDEYPNQFLFAVPSNCINLETDSGMYAPDISKCDNSVYRFQADSGSLELLFDVSGKSIYMPNDTRHYYAQTGMLMVVYENQPNIIPFVDVNKQCVVFELDPWILGAPRMQWYDEEHIADVALATHDNRTPAIRMYRLQELASETPSSCLYALSLSDN